MAWAVSGDNVSASAKQCRLSELKQIERMSSASIKGDHIEEALAVANPRF